MLRIHNLILVALAIILSSSAFACKLGGDSVEVPVDVLIAESELIVLAKAENSKIKNDISRINTVSFIPIEVLKSNDLIAQESYTSAGSFFDKNGWGQAKIATSIKDIYQSDFNGHKEMTFWTENIGRTPYDPSCKIKPVFVEGEMYLLFFSKYNHNKMYELIQSDDDKWLWYVKNRIWLNQKANN